jgi:hypothetical protein
VIRTELQKRVGGYRAELPHTGDMEMWLRLAAHASVGVLEAYQAVYRRHASNMSLAYLGMYRLADFQQRRAAIDCFVRSCGHTRSDIDQLHRRLVWQLACEALGSASAAFNNGEMDASQQLSQFALDASPETGKSMSWMKLAFKRHMGLGVSRVLVTAAMQL